MHCHFFQTNTIFESDLDEFLKYTQDSKDLDEMFHALLLSSRREMGEWVKIINAQFLSQVAVTVDRLNGIGAQSNATAECLLVHRNAAGSEIQEIVREVISDLDFYQRDYVYLYQDSVDRYVAINQKTPLLLLLTWNSMTQFNIVLELMEGIVFEFYRQIFEPIVEEILLDMGHFNDLINETKLRAFTALSNISMEIDLATC